MRLAVLFALVFAAGCGSKAKDDSPRGRCERGCTRMRECTDVRFGRTSSGDPAQLEACVNLCLQVGPPDDARLQFMETSSCAEVIKPGAKKISVPAPSRGAEVEAPIQTPGDNK